MATVGNPIPEPDERADNHASGPAAITTAAALMADIERQIASGVLPPGHRLAPVRDAAKELGLAPNTVSRAYRTLQDRGLVYGEGRRGTFVAERPSAVVTADEPTPDGLVDLAAGNPDPELLPDLGVALSRIATGHVAYGHPPIDEQLAAALTADLGPDLGLEADAASALKPGETLAVVGGALDGIERTLLAHLRPGDRVAVEDPAYSSVLNLVSALNLRAIPFPIDDRGPLPDGLDQALSQGVEAVIITPRAQNPTGAAMDADRAQAVAESLRRHPEVLVIEDDHAGPVAGVRYESAIPGDTSNWVVIRSVAKSLGPDLRLAALAGDPTTVGRVISRQLLGTGWVSHILQRTVAELLSEPSTHALLAVASATYAERRNAFAGRLTSAGIACHHRSGLNVWVPVDDEATVVAGMQQRGFAIRSGARYRQLAPPAVRISTAGSSVAALERGADALIDLLNGGLPSRSV